MSTPKNKIIITGKIGVGKSTLIKSILADANIRFSCFQTSPILSDKNVRGFELGDSERPERYRFATLFKPQFTGLEKYEIDNTIFDTHGVEIIERLQAQSRLIVLDELGIMEFNSPLFLQAISNVLNSDRAVIAVIQHRALEKYMQNIDIKKCIIFNVSALNRNKLKSSIVTCLKKSMSK